jgi:protein subunit release factor A
MNDTTHINPEEYADDHRVAFLVAEWKRLSQAEKDAAELVEVDPAMKELAEKELHEIAEQKEQLMQRMEAVVGRPGEREWPNELILEVRAGVGGEEASLFAE